LFKLNKVNKGTKLQHSRCLILILDSYFNVNFVNFLLLTYCFLNYLFVVFLLVSLVKHYAWLCLFFFSFIISIQTLVFVPFIAIDYFSLVLIVVALAPSLLLSPLVVVYGLSSLWFNGSLIIQTSLWSDNPGSTTSSGSVVSHWFSNPLAPSR